MTHHVSEAYKRHRRGTWIGALGVLAAVTAVGLMIVLPAFAATGDSIEPQSGTGVVPTELSIGGSNFSCANNTGGTPAGMSQLQISKPTAGSYTDPATGVTFVLTNDIGGKDRQKYFSFSVAGADVFHVGVNGGTNTAWYAYPSAGVVSDTNLHATKDNKGTLYNASITTFCFIPKFFKISGTVFLADASEQGLDGWTISLTKTGGATLNATSGAGSWADGYYEFPNVPAGANYLVCATAPSGTGAWYQTEPSDNARCQTVSPGTPAGIAIEPLQKNETADFGNLPVVPLPADACENPFNGLTLGSSINSYQAQLQGDPSACKNGDVVMYTTTNPDGSIVAALHETPGAGGDTLWVIERISWTKPGSNMQNAVFIKYDDEGPDYGDVLNDALMCDDDLRTDDFVVPVADAASMMPGTETTCVIESTDLTGGGYVAFLLSSVDGYRFTG